MTRKDYIKFADILSKYSVSKNMIKELMEYFKSDNSYFNESKFIEYYEIKRNSIKFNYENGNKSKFGKEAIKEFVENL